MHRSLAIVVTVASLLAGTAARADDAALLRRESQALFDAVAPGHRDVWEKRLDADFLHMDENGIVRDKQALLKELKPLPEGLVGRIEIDTFRARFHGDTAVTAYELQEYLDYHGQPLRTRFRSLDTWRRTPGGWRLVAMHTTAVLKDPPAIALGLGRDCEYAGIYALTDAIRTTLTCEADGLVAKREGRADARYRAEVKDVFFEPGKPRSRRVFVRDDAGRIVAFADRREGEDIRWRKVAPARSAGSE